jgi:hypothetical protein
MDWQRLADVRAGTSEEIRSGGTGHLLGGTLVLTCRHVVEDGEGRPWSRVQVRLGHPAHGPQRHARATVVWASPDVDAALLRIDGEPFVAGDPVRWGWFIGSSPIVYEGLGYPVFVDYESGRGVEQLGGTVPPGALGPDGTYVLDQGAAPEATRRRRRWRGVSGAAVFCADLLTGIVTRDDDQFGNRRLYAVPAHALIADPDFARLVAEDGGTPPVLEPVELAPCLQPRGRQLLARTPGSLLAATAEAVSFIGRVAEMAALASWRDGGQRFSVMLIAGEGGQGKTRLAREFCTASREAGWVAAFLESHYLQAIEQVPGANQPVLLVVDYAETRAQEVTALIDGLPGGQAAQPVRLLLLSRTAGAWWSELTGSGALPPECAQRIDLAPLTDNGDARRGTYVAALAGLAQRLALLPDSPIGRDPSLPWIDLGKHLARQPRPLDDPRLGNALTLQMTALDDLLTSAAGQEAGHSGTSAERSLVIHERNYLWGAAAKHGLFAKDVLSDLTNDDERKAEARRALERALAGIILLGPCDGPRARAVGALASAARAEDVTIWLAELYPPPSVDFRVGTVQPDRLAELLLGPVLTQQTGALSQIAALAGDVGDAYAVLFALLRTAAHPDYDRVGEQIHDLLISRPDPFARAAPVLAAMLPPSLPLLAGLRGLGQRDPQAFTAHAYEAVMHLPLTSVSGAYFSAALSTVMTVIVRALADSDPDTYFPLLAASLSDLGARLAQAGQQQAALAAAREAVDAYRQLAQASPGSYLFGYCLAEALNSLGNRLHEARQPRAALTATQEASGIYRRLAQADPDTFLPYLALSLINLGVMLTNAGQREAALDAAEEAVGINRRLADADPDIYLPQLATALSNLGGLFGEAGQREAALTVAREAVTITRRLADADPDRYLPGLARSLSNLGNQLADAGQREAALAMTEKAITIQRRLAEVNPDKYLPGLAAALKNLVAHFAEDGQREAALDAAEKAIAIYRQLAQADPDTYYPHLAIALRNLGAQLADAGQWELARSPTSQALHIHRMLGRTNPDEYLAELAASLNSFGALFSALGHQADADKVWESAIRDLPEQASRMTLSVDYARYLLARQDWSASAEQLARILTAPDASGRVQAAARRLMRRCWRQQAQDTERAWQSVSPSPLPDWVSLSESHVDTAIDWILTRTAADSHAYFLDHVSELLSPAIVTILEEIALSAPAEVIDQHRALLEAGREHRLDEAYRPLLLRDALEEWMATPDHDTSRAYLLDNLDLLSEDASRILQSLDDHDYPEITAHHAMLTLAREPAGIDRAYECLTDADAIKALAHEAIAAHDAARIQACAVIEADANPLTSYVHQALAMLMTEPSERLPASFVNQLRDLARQAGAAERNTVATEFIAAVASLRMDSAAASEVQKALEFSSEE